MSSMPREIILDTLLPLDRWTLDTVQITNGRFRQLIEEFMDGVCLRQINSASFSSSEGRSWVNAANRRELELSSAYEDFAGFFSAFVQSLRNSRIGYLRLQGIDLPQARATLALEKAPIVAHNLSVRTGSSELTPAQLHALLSHFSPTELDLRFEPVDDGSLSVMDDAIDDFCMRPDVPAGQGDGEPKPYAELRVRNGRFSKGLLKRLVEASAVSTRTQSFLINLVPVRLEDEDLRDFAHHLKYHRRRGQQWEQRVYDFPGEQRGAAAPMNLQITLETSPLSTGYALAMVRDRRGGLPPPSDN